MTERRPDRVLGHNHDVFWEGCSQGELRIQHCSGCDRLYWPAARKCEHCDCADFTWQTMSGRGRIVSWSTFVQDYYQGRLPVPYDTLLVELEEGVMFISNPHGFTEAEIVPDMPVEVRFIPCEDSAGPFSLPVFAKAG